MIMLIDK